MKLLVKILVVTLVMASAAMADVKQDLLKSLNANLANRGITGIKIEVDVLEQLKSPKGYSFVKVTLHQQGQAQEQYLITDGVNVLPDIVNLKTNATMKSMLTFKHTPAIDIEPTGLTLLAGNPDAKNVIIDISDFQCPFCARAYQYLHQAIAGRDDVAIYLMNMPLPNHEKADLMARIFEAGASMGKDFSAQLFLDKKLANMADTALVQEFAAKTDDPSKFTAMVNSNELKSRIASQKARAQSLGVNATPALYFNGKKVDGFNKEIIDFALEEMK